jgi:hypothetical protein
MLIERGHVVMPDLPADFHNSDRKVFVAEFADGVTTRMTVRCRPGEYDLPRAVALSRRAWHSRVRHQRLRPTVPPPIVRGLFVRPTAKGDAILADYPGELIADLPAVTEG